MIEIKKKKTITYNVLYAKNDKIPCLRLKK